MKDLRLKQKWKGFLKRSGAYKMAILYGIIGLIFLCVSFYSMTLMATEYRDGIGFYVETPEQLRTLGFLICMMLVSGSTTILALLMWICSLYMFMSDQEKRLRKMENFLEEDGVFNFRKDED